MGVITFLLIGLIAGLIARAVMPGRQEMGLIATALLGMAGSLLGGLVGSLISTGEPFSLRPSGIILSIVGAILLLALLGFVRTRRRVPA